MANRHTDGGDMDAIALVGPTASGKSGVAMAFAAAHLDGVEIISMDSAQVYRGMDIGTAKPGAQDRAAVPQHLIDILEPSASYSAAAFARDATRLIGEIRARGRLPLLVGGSMLYLRALLHGLDEMPAADPKVRQAIDAQAREFGWPWLHGQLALADPVTAARLAPNDAQRIQRALEVLRISSRPLSSFQLGRQGKGIVAADRVNEAQSPQICRPLVRILSLEPMQRSWLHERIAARFDAMLSDGLVEEVKALRARADLSAALPSMRCVGYRQTWEALDGSLPWAQLRERGVQATRQLAKRQLTWLRAMPDRQVLACDAPDAQERALEVLSAWARSRPGADPRPLHDAGQS